MTVENASRVEIPELAVVALRHAHAGHARGAIGVVVSAHPQEDDYVVEVVDAVEATTEIVHATSADLRVTHVL